MDDIPSYSKAGKASIDVFYQDYVSAIFYFEDENHESVYERLLFRLLPGIRPFKVVCLGGKTILIAKAKAIRQEGANATKQVFILDKDFDDLLGTIFIDEDVHYLHAFSIENYFVDLNGIINLAIERNSRNLTFNSALACCANYSCFVERLQQCLVRISRLFVVARKHRVDVKTTKLSVKELLEGADDGMPIPTEEWYSNYLTNFKDNLPPNAEHLANDDCLNFELERAFTKHDRVEFPDIPITDHICGKHYFMCLLRAVEKWIGIKLSDMDVVELYIRLASHIDLKRLDFLRQKILSTYPDLFRPPS